MSGTSNILHKAAIFIMFVMFIIMIWSCYNVFDNTPIEYPVPTKTEYYVVPSEMYNPVLSEEESKFISRTGMLPKSVQMRLNAKTNARIDSIKAEHSKIKEKLDNSLSDIRQETNNIINKTNGWLGFWIAMAALLGIGIPLCSQLLISRELRDDIEQLKRKNEMNKDHMLIAQMRFGIDNKIITAQSGQNFAKHTWSEILSNDEKKINRLLDKRLSTESRREIQGILIQLCELATEFKRRIYAKDIRDFDKPIDKLRLIFIQLDSDAIDRKRLQKDVATLLNQLSSLI